MEEMMYGEKRAKTASGAIRILGMLALCIILSFAGGMTAGATTLEELQQQIEKHKKELESANEKLMNLEDKKSLLQELIDDLNCEMINTMAQIGLAEEEIADKEEQIAEKNEQIGRKEDEIAVKEQEYAQAKAEEEKQQDDMQVRLRRVYETGNSSVIGILLQGSGIGSLLNRFDFVEQLYTYDRNKLEEYKKTKEHVKELWDALEVEKEELEQQKLSLEADIAQVEEAKRELDVQREELNRALEIQKKQSSNYDAEIQRARQEANVVKALIKQEQQELQKLQEENKPKPTDDDIVDTGYAKWINDSPGSELGKRIAKFACQYIGNPYVYGGTSLTNGTDCSGFTMRVYQNFGYSITRTSLSQRSDGKEVDYSNAEPGDIICYSGHVALYIGRGKIVHASNQRDGIKVSNATYREILTVRRII